MERPEFKQLKKAGYKFDNPWEVIDIFEKKVAEFWIQLGDAFIFIRYFAMHGKGID